MEQNQRARLREKLVRIPEYGIGLILLSKGWEEAEHLEQFPVRVVVIFLAAVFVIAGATFHRQLERRIKNSTGLFHILEGVVEIICATILLEKGKHWLPIFLAFLGLFYLSGGLVQLLTGAENRERAERRLRMCQAVAFIVFAVATALATSLTDREPMVYLMDVFFVAVGISILVRKGRPCERISLLGRLLDRLDKRSS